MSFSNIMLLLAAITTALITGTFYAYSCSVNPGLGRLNDAQYLVAMQSINRAILNPVFMFSFMGTLLALPISVYLNYTSSNTTRFILLVGAAGVYFVGAFAVTIFGNVPLNEALDAVNLQSASAEDMAKYRLRFEASWNRLHFIRTMACLVSLIFVIIACLNNAQEG
jgi:uncharacterized membrane protein